MSTLSNGLVRCRALLDAAERIERVQEVVRTEARRLMNAQGATFVVREDDRCFYVDEDSVAPLWKGQRFPITECISGWSMLHRATAVVPDITVDARIPQAAYRPTYIVSLAMTPIRRADPLGAIGVYWASPHQAGSAEVAALERLADLTATAIERIGLRHAPWAPSFDRRVEVPAQPSAPAAAALRPAASA